MKKSTNLKRQVFNKKKFKETVDTEFSQLVQPEDPSFFDLDLATLKDFGYYTISFSMIFLNWEKMNLMNIYPKPVVNMLM